MTRNADEHLGDVVLTGIDTLLQVLVIIKYFHIRTRVA